MTTCRGASSCLVLTNAHVVRAHPAQQPWVHVHGNGPFAATVVFKAACDVPDVALLHVAGVDTHALASIAVASSASLAALTGERVELIGMPVWHPSKQLGPMCTAGTATARHTSAGDCAIITHTAAGVCHAMHARALTHTRYRSTSRQQRRRAGAGM